MGGAWGPERFAGPFLHASALGFLTEGKGEEALVRFPGSSLVGPAVVVLGTHVMGLGNHVIALESGAARDEHHAVPFTLNELIGRSMWSAA